MRAIRLNPRRRLPPACLPARQATLEKQFIAVAPWIRHTMLRYCGRRGIGPPALDDCLQEALLAAWIALPRWQPHRGNLATFLYPRILGAVKDSVRRELDLDDRQLAKLARAGKRPPERECLRRVLWDYAHHPVQALESADQVRWILQRIPAGCWRTVFVAVVCRGQTLAAAGRELGVNESRAAQIYKCACAEARHHLAGRI